ncbi:Protein of uncharacterised function (DUF964) [uncultured Roseburia sp.]|uniref:YlbF family regulator n=1 Tax=Brotonthovivens ammoniilytica TaxID=2981725 RepID=A0ABT2TMD3_9FIRM|nr:YlbF family regulator [Brotonthovivens ammoniilytica]MCU6763388.1 YlbF family regulator [Brotonthovivens ammoniilytica]SCJ17556.1 Protein of uncharacterised function (DUF964) [uncultured Roseburia sp.]
MEENQEKTNDYADYNGGVDHFMNDIEKAANSFLAAVKNSSEYQRYQKARSEIRQYPEKVQKLYEFKKRNYELQNSGDRIDLFSELDQLQKEYNEFRNDAVWNYLEAESTVCKMIRQINWMLAENLEIETVLPDDERQG